MEHWLIGIGITTRNRAYVLDTALQHFILNLPAESKLVVVDDASDNQGEVVSLVNNISYQRPDCDIAVRLSSRRLGISNAKNACLSALSGCDHVFLFDDDCWPITPDWAEKWININRTNGIQHSMFNVGMGALLDRNPAFKAVVRARRTIGDSDTMMVSYSNCFGVMLYFTRECLNAVGGYDTETSVLYGYEHAQISQRIASFGHFTQNEHYWTPWIATDLIYSVDISYCMLKIEPPIFSPWLTTFTSSVTPEEMALAEENAFIMHRNEQYIPLIDPFT